MVCANAYIGAEPIADALLAGAQIVVTGRVADPSLTVGPALAHFGWRRDDWDRLGARDDGRAPARMRRPGQRRLLRRPGLSRTSPTSRTSAIRSPRSMPTATARSPSRPAPAAAIDAHTVKEQLLYEVHDPAAYLTPDVVADISEARVVELGPDRVRLDGVRGHARPATLKVNVFSEQGWLAEGEISYAGARAEARARLAADVLRQRLRRLGRCAST